MIPSAVNIERRRNGYLLTMYPDGYYGKECNMTTFPDLVPLLVTLLAFFETKDIEIKVLEKEEVEDAVTALSSRKQRPMQSSGRTKR